jgi:hypothetical protein
MVLPVSDTTKVARCVSAHLHLNAATRRASDFGLFSKPPFESAAQCLDRCGKVKTCPASGILKFKGEQHQAAVQYDDLFTPCSHARPMFAIIRSGLRSIRDMSMMLPQDTLAKPPAWHLCPDSWHSRPQILR